MGLFWDWIREKFGYRDNTNWGSLAGAVGEQLRPRPIMKGARGADVLDIQDRLHALGYLRGVVDGDFGSKTLEAVVAFQSANGLIPDGVVGEKTLAKLHDPNAKIAPVELKPLPVEHPIDSLQGIDKQFKKGTDAWYEAAYRIMQFDRGMSARIESAARRVLLGKPQYVRVEDATKVPWYMIGVIHNMECSCNFKGVLHNGEAIVGTGRKTRLVPAGRGPFATWYDAALDAIRIQGMYRDDGGGWPLGHVLKLLELFNGAGYLKFHPQENTPYLWACTTINDGTGKYVADGHWSESADANAQVGCAAIIRQLELWGELTVKYKT